MTEELLDILYTGAVLVTQTSCRMSERLCAMASDMERNIMWSTWSEPDLESDFSAVVPIDSDGQVIEYPDLFKRL